jgi:hypothetical protein
MMTDPQPIHVSIEPDRIHLTNAYLLASDGNRISIGRHCSLPCRCPVEYWNSDWDHEITVTVDATRNNYWFWPDLPCPTPPDERIGRTDNQVVVLCEGKRLVAWAFQPDIGHTPPVGVPIPTS